MPIKLFLFIAMLLLAVSGLACSRLQPVVDLTTVEKLSDADGKTQTASPSPVNAVEPFPPPTNARYLRVSNGVMLGAASKKVWPQYPLEAQAKGITGSVQVQLTVDGEGNVVKAEVLSGPSLLHDVALQAAKGWEYRPTMDMPPGLFVVGTLEFKFPPQ